MTARPCPKPPAADADQGGGSSFAPLQEVGLMDERRHGEPHLLVDWTTATNARAPFLS
jgi:hypothetical protein